MAEDCFPSGTTTFWLRSDFPLEFCFDDWIHRPPSEYMVRLLLEPGEDFATEYARSCERIAQAPLHWCHAYYGIIRKGQTTAQPCISDGCELLTVPEEGLFRAMLNRLADAMETSRHDYPLIYPRVLIDPAPDEVLPEWVVLHDSIRSRAGLVPYRHALEYLSIPF